MLLVLRIITLLYCLFIFTKASFAQVPDSPIIPKADSIKVRDTSIKKAEQPPLLVRDTIIKKVQQEPVHVDNNDTVAGPIEQVPIRDSLEIIPKPVINNSWALEPGRSVNSDQLGWEILKRHPYFGFTSELIDQRSEIRTYRGKELMFYVLIGLLLLFSLLRQAFPKYFNDLFRLFFRTTLKQRQVREQLIQTPLPSLLLNGFFVVSAGMYLSHVLRYFELDPVGNYWLLSFYCALGLSAGYFVKYLSIRICGWLFSMKEAADSYVFIVFVINKMMGIALLPFLILLGFTEAGFYSVAMTLSWIAVFCLFVYRFILAYAAIRNQVKVNPFHFFLYLLAFEIAPLLLVYKGLLLFLRIST